MGMTHNTHLPVWLFSLVTLGTIGCGDDLTDGRYQGEPLFRVRGQVEALAAGGASEGVLIGMLWTKWNSPASAYFQSAEVSATSFPQRYEMAVFDPPPPALMNDLGGVLLGSGYITVFADSNEDGRIELAEFSESGRRGLALNHVVLFLPVLDGPALEALRQWGGIANLSDLRQGYMLAKGRCSADGASDQLLIIDDEPVPVRPSSEPLNCLNLN